MHTLLSGPFDDLRSRDLRFLHEASKIGPVDLRLWPDAAILEATGKPPKFPEAERLYYLESVRYVDRVRLESPANGPDAPPRPDLLGAATWVVRAQDDSPAKAAAAAAAQTAYHVIPEADLDGFPEPPAAAPSGRPKVIVTGCFDWFHSGHVRFFEEVSELGDLLVVVGNDANVRHLKGDGHPMFDENERRYIAGSIKFVTASFVSTGMGWMDAEPEIHRLKPEIYAVNEDGDKPEKQEFCARHNLRYVVLRRTPKPGLARRSSTDLRGF
jgi:cytidyltransferase-like protein